MEYGQLFGFQMSGSEYAPFADERAYNPKGHRAAYAVPNLFIVMVAKFQDTRVRIDDRFIMTVYSTAVLSFTIDDNQQIKNQTDID